LAAELERQLALVTSDIFFAAAIFINIAEWRARLRLKDKALIAEWKPSSKRGFSMQA
jgi:hypothetical protein